MKRIDKRKGDRHRPGYWGPYQKARRARLKALQAKLGPPRVAMKSSD